VKELLARCKIGSASDWPSGRPYNGIMRGAG
jgi:hypothetical protein